MFVTIIVRPHRSTTYIGAACYYRPSSVVCLSVTVGPAKMAEPIEMPFELRTLVGPRNHVIDGGPVLLWEGAILRGEGSSIVKYRDTLQSSLQRWLNRLRCPLGCGLRWAQSRVRWTPDPPWEGVILRGKGTAR